MLSVIEDVTTGVFRCDNIKSLLFHISVAYQWFHTIHFPVFHNSFIMVIYIVIFIGCGVKFRTHRSCVALNTFQGFGHSLSTYHRKLPYNALQN